MVNCPSPLVVAPYCCADPARLRVTETRARSTGAPVTELVTAPERLASWALAGVSGVWAVTVAARKRSRYRIRQELSGVRLCGFAPQAMGPRHELLATEILFAEYLQIFDDAVALLDFNLQGHGFEGLQGFVPIAGR